MEQLEQEITWELQKIDNNITASFQLVTQEIIPNVRAYGEHCTEIIDNLQWLVQMLEQTGNVNLLDGANGGGSSTADADASGNASNTIFPELSKENTNTINNGSLDNDRMNLADDTKDEDTIEYHTANITSTGQILRLPEFSDDEEEVEGSGKLKHVPRRKPSSDKSAAHNDINVVKNSNTNTPTQGNSTLQKQQRKRKVSLLLQQEYQSSSSALPSPVIQSKNNNTNTNSHTDNMHMDSSPIRKPEDKGADNTTLQFPTA